MKYCLFCSFFLRSLWSYFVVKSLHFLKESKYFSFSFLYYETTKITEKIWKNVSLKLRGFNLSFCHGTIYRLVIWYVKSVCKIYVFLELKWRHCSVTIAFVLLIISSFNRYFWRFWPYLEFLTRFLLMDPKLPHNVRNKQIFYPFYLDRELWRHIY